MSEIASLVDLLLATIRLVEAIARAATEGPWTVDTHDDGTLVVKGSKGPVVFEYGYGTSERDFSHIALNDPPWVLRACEADRRTVERHKAVLVEGRNADGDEREGYSCECCDDPWPCLDLLDRAAAYGIEH